MHIYTYKRSIIGTSLIVGSLMLHVVTLLLYMRRPDFFAAYTIFPIWIWGGIGFMASAIAFLIYRAPFSLVLCTVWLMTLLLKSDEAPALVRFDYRAPQPLVEGEERPKNIIRVATLNCSMSGQLSPDDFKKWAPDILFLQEIPSPYQIKKLAEKLYDQKGDYRYDVPSRCAVLVRGEVMEQRVPKHSRGHHLTLRLYNGYKIEAINLHLRKATTDLNLWKKTCWRNHNIHRKIRRGELRAHLYLFNKEVRYPMPPALIVGDFNAPAQDGVYKTLDKDFYNVFSEAGVGWGNTYHRRFPILRIDHIYANYQFQPVSSRTVRIPQSDHLMVIADLKLKHYYP